VFGENFYDGTPSLQGDALDAIMNYQAFTVPVWRWLAGFDIGSAKDNSKPYADETAIPAEAAAEQMQSFMAGVPWAVSQIQFNLLGSHDTTRILSICHDDEALAKLAAVLLLTYPGVPSIYYGDEIGMTGWGDPQNRRGMVWDESRWNVPIREHYKRLIEIRRSYEALQTGGLQFLLAEGDTLAYVRESQTQRMIVIGHRGNTDSHTISVPVEHSGIANGTQFSGLLGGGQYSVTHGAISFNLGQSATFEILFAAK
jgi:alpha-glucosidase